jgi:hypothetical protein
MTHNFKFSYSQNCFQGSNEAGVGTGTGQIYSHPINNTLIDPTQIRQQSQHPNPNMQSYGAGPQTHMAMRNGQTPT